MGTPMFSDTDFVKTETGTGRLVLEDGSRVAVIGSGPAGSLFSYYLLEMAERMDLDIQVDLYESRDFSRPAPGGCNMCGGIISESLVQNLATDGINLPSNVVQRSLDSYVLHMDVGTVRIDTPLHEKRIAAVTRGSGPRDIQEMKWDSFDGHLQGLAMDQGANVISQRVSGITTEAGYPVVNTRAGSPSKYDLLVLAVGVNSPLVNLVKQLDFDYQPPGTTKTFICEYYFGEELIQETLGSSMHVFLLDIPRLEFAAIIPKGDYATVCMLGDDIDDQLVEAFLNSPEVKNCMPAAWDPGGRSCWCLPRINVKAAATPYADRMLFIGDCGVTRLYKDGIGAAYRTAKAAATTAILQGISAADFEHYFMPTCQTITRDNFIGRLNFLVTGQIKGLHFARRALLNMTSKEQEMDSSSRRMSVVLWDMFTGSAPYQEILLRTIHPAFLLQFVGYLLAAGWYQLTNRD
jgi:flavin-dependent dehydrogenase